MILPQIFLPNTNTVNAVIETPRGSRNKYGYNQQYDYFELDKVLPAGTSFPYDFGFIPYTKGADGDPLDILVINDCSSFSGCIISVRIIGVLIAEQKKEQETLVRNDRIVGVAAQSLSFSDLKEISDINANLLNEIIHFLEYYNNVAGKEFKITKTKNSNTAIQLIKDQIIKR